MDRDLEHHVNVIALAEEHLPVLPPTAGLSTPLLAARTLLDMVTTAAIERGLAQVETEASLAARHVHRALRLL